jgi:hypothetical protein
MSIARVVAVAAFVVTSVITGCGGTDIDPADPMKPAEVGTTSQGVTCIGQCDQERYDCENWCIENYHPYWDESQYRACMDSCGWNYESCLDYTYVFEAQTYQICQIDPDMHWNGVDVELYTADSYVDPTCADSPRYYRKRMLDSVHCGFISESSCKDRVGNRIMTDWAPQGYYPTVTESDGDTDKCPRPRL